MSDDEGYDTDVADDDNRIDAPTTSFIRPGWRDVVATYGTQQMLDPDPRQKFLGEQRLKRVREVDDIIDAAEASQARFGTLMQAADNAGNAIRAQPDENMIRLFTNTMDAVFPAWHANQQVGQRLNDRADAIQARDNQAFRRQRRMNQIRRLRAGGQAAV